MSLIVALQGGAGSVGLVGSDVSSAMSNAAMAKACEVLRRELKLIPDLRTMRVVVVDVGDVMASNELSRSQVIGRKPTPAKHFTIAIGRIVGYSRPQDVSSCHRGSKYTRAIGGVVCAVGLSARDWWRGDRFSIGAGAGTYSIASHLPTRFLDVMLLLPRRLISYRDWLRTETVNADRQAREMARERRRQQQKDKETTTGPSLEPRRETQGPPKLIQHRDSLTPQNVGSKPSSSAATSDIDSIPSDVDHELEGLSDPESEGGKSVASASSAPGPDNRLGESWVSLKGEEQSLSRTITNQSELENAANAQP